MRTIEHWIGGRPTTGTSSRRGPVFNPATGKQTAEVLLASREDVSLAVRVAGEAGAEWAETSVSRRMEVMFSFREILNARADEVARAITDEHGKALSDALGEVGRGREVVEFACGLSHLLKGEYSDQVSSGVDAYSFRQPLGVVAGITPFNFPAMVPMWMFPLAIACGNAFVLKPSERNPSVSNLVAEMWLLAGLPDGVFNVVHGDKEAVDALLDHPDVAAVSFVGSTPVAKYVHREATAKGKRVQALGGAKNHAVVLPDANLDFATNHLASAAFGSAGERCMAISATVAVGRSGPRLIEALEERASSIRLGPGYEPNTEMGPVITAAARDRIVGLIDSGERQGARVRVDGRNAVVPGYEGGFFVGPTILEGVLPHMDVYTTEIFGPVLSVLSVDSVDDALELINSSPYGNGTAIFTNSGGAARRFSRGVEVGMVGVNVPVPVPMAFYSFGGWKGSLFGDRHIHGPEGVAFYTRGKVVTSRWPATGEDSPPSLDFPTAE